MYSEIGGPMTLTVCGGPWVGRDDVGVVAVAADGAAAAATGAAALADGGELPPIRQRLDSPLSRLPLPQGASR